MICAKCGFSQPDDYYCAGCGVDIERYAKERKMERALAERYRQSLEMIGARLHAGNLSLAIELASLPEAVRGYGHIKDASLVECTQQLESFDERFRSSAQETLRRSA